MATIKSTNKSAKDSILDYVMNTPGNSNPNVLKTILEDSGKEKDINGDIVLKIGDSSKDDYIFAIDNIIEIDLKENITGFFESNPFSQLHAIKKITTRGVKNMWYGDKRQGTFYDLNYLQYVYMFNVEKIGPGLFPQCYSLSEVYIDKTCTEIDSIAFHNIPANCKVTINCGFDENVIPGAPWGAGSNVTINYNVPIPSNQ